MSRRAVTRTGNTDYRDGYSKSPAWFARRDQWFVEFRQITGCEPFCYVCDATKAHLGSLDLHHLNYDGVQRGARNQWVAAEKHEDLVPLCRACHDDVHNRLDDGKTYYGWSRETATFIVIRDLRNRLGKTDRTQMPGVMPAAGGGNHQ